MQACFSDSRFHRSREKLKKQKVPSFFIVPRNPHLITVSPLISHFSKPDASRDSKFVSNFITPDRFLPRSNLKLNLITKFIISFAIFELECQLNFDKLKFEHTFERESRNQYSSESKIELEVNFDRDLTSVSGSILLPEISLSYCLTRNTSLQQHIITCPFTSRKIIENFVYAKINLPKFFLRPKVANFCFDIIFRFSKEPDQRTRERGPVSPKLTLIVSATTRRLSANELCIYLYIYIFTHNSRRAHISQRPSHNPRQCITRD